ncbi:MAG: hemoglobin [Solirubrobacteraceae bacterium]|nr:hemoglobin [Solirubrobacteraceae bacterium]
MWGVDRVQVGGVVRAAGPAARLATIACMSQPTVPTPPPMGFYDAVRGEPTFRRIVGRFFAEVAADPILRAVYTDEDLGPAEDRLRLFLMQYWGGPTTYSDARGHPRLRMRHAPFAIGVRERDAWLRAMRVAVDEAGLAESRREQLWSYLESTATHMINRHG